MTGSNGNNRGARLDAYLDALGEPQRRGRLRTIIDGDPELLADLAHQEQIDAALGRLYVPPSLAAAVARLERVSALKKAAALTPLPLAPQVVGRAADTAGALQGLKAWAALAIIAAGVIATAWTAVRYWPASYSSIPALPPEYMPGHIPPNHLEHLYHRYALRGFLPGHACGSHHEFAEGFRLYLGQSLRLAEPPAGVTPLGLSALPGQGPSVLLLTARVNGQGVLVLVDRASTPRSYGLSPDSGLNLFPHRVGALRLYEITPLAEPHLLALFEPAAPGSPAGLGSVQPVHNGAVQ